MLLLLRNSGGYCTSAGTVKISKILYGITKQAEAVNRSERWGEGYSARVNASHTGTLLLGLKPDIVAQGCAIDGSYIETLERGQHCKGKEKGKMCMLRKIIAQGYILEPKLIIS